MHIVYIECTMAKGAREYGSFQNIRKINFPFNSNGGGTGDKMASVM
jgi:hypothetical protein